MNELRQRVHRLQWYTGPAASLRAVAFGRRVFTLLNRDLVAMLWMESRQSVGRVAPMFQRRRWESNPLDAALQAAATR